MPKGIPLTQEEQDRRRREIVEAAVGLFYEKGFTETSMREIAAAAGAGKSTLYDYFATKDEILLSYFENEIHAIRARIEAIEGEPIPAPEKLCRVLEAQLEYLLANKKFYLKMTIEAQRLSLAGQQSILESRHAYQDTIARLIAAGIAEGAFRPVDPHLAMRIVLGALTPLAFTTRPTASPREMLASTMDILMHGLQA